MLFFSASEASRGNTWMRVEHVHVQEEKKDPKADGFAYDRLPFGEIITKYCKHSFFVVVVVKRAFLISSKSISSSAPLNQTISAVTGKAVSHKVGSRSLRRDPTGCSRGPGARWGTAWFHDHFTVVIKAQWQHGLLHYLSSLEVSLFSLLSDGQ